MAKNVLAVYDPCSDYVERFLRYANKKAYSGFEVWGYTDLNILEESLQNERIIAMLLSHENNDEGGLKRILKPTASEHMNRDLTGMVLGEQQDAAGIESFAFIDKYQPAGKILEQAINIVKSEHPEIVECAAGKRLNVSGVYSPADKLAHPYESARVANLIRRAEKNSSMRILYINLEPFSAMDHLLDHVKDTNMSDIIYYYRAGKRHMERAVRETVGRYAGMDVLTYPQKSDDLDEIGREGWAGFLESLTLAGEYEHIILDISSWTDQMADLLLKYGSLYIVTPENIIGTTDRNGGQKLTEFRKYLERIKNDNELERIFELKPDAYR